LSLARNATVTASSRLRRWLLSWQKPLLSLEERPSAAALEELAPADIECLRPRPFDSPAGEDFGLESADPDWAEPSKIRRVLPHKMLAQLAAFDDRASPVGVDDADLPVAGDLIDTTYRVTRELGRGGMGVVLAAFDERLQRKVAIKLIRPKLSTRADCERLLQEARAMARVSHPNVISIHAFGQHGLVPYFAMQLIEGKSLDVWRRERTELIELDTKLSFLNDVCNGVSAIHATGTIHRDIKPGNILIDAQLHAWVADFGICVADSEDDAENGIVGTPTYMAPELSSSLGTSSQASDVYSLARVAYELLVGPLPSRRSRKHAAFSPELPAPSSVGPELPASLDRLFAESLACDPAARTRSVEQFRRQLLLACEHDPESARFVFKQAR
jgi:serine/threonine-protein kinase